MTNTELNKLRFTLAEHMDLYQSNRQMLGIANMDGTDKSGIFRNLNKSRAIILNTMLAIRIEVESRRPLREVLDRVTRENSAFKDFDDLINSTGDHYSPSMDMREPQMVFLANYFDMASKLELKSCRAYRYGVNW